MSSGNINSCTHLSTLGENDIISRDCTITLEIYIQQEVHYDRNQLIRSDEPKSCYKTILCLMAVPIHFGLPILVQTIPFVRANHKRFFDFAVKILHRLRAMPELTIRAICSDNNRVNTLLQHCGNNKCDSIQWILNSSYF